MDHLSGLIIDIQALFISPSGKKWEIPGFYNYSQGTLWKIRFSPNETGKWNYSVTVRDKNGEVISSTQSFVAIKSSRKGPIQVAANKRYLEHSDGSHFYGVGLWYNDSYAGFNNGIQSNEVIFGWVVNSQTDAANASVTLLRNTGSHANYIGQDFSFILERLPKPVPLLAKPKSPVLAK